MLVDEWMHWVLARSRALAIAPSCKRDRRRQSIPTLRLQSCIVQMQVRVEKDKRGSQSWLPYSKRYLPTTCAPPGRRFNTYGLICVLKKRRSTGMGVHYLGACLVARLDQSHLNRPSQRVVVFCLSLDISPAEQRNYRHVGWVDKQC